MGLFNWGKGDGDRNPNAAKKTEHDIPDHAARTTYNRGIDQARAEREKRDKEKLEREQRDQRSKPRR